jgi:hypothetical protein
VGRPYGTPTVAQPWGNLLVSYSNVLGFNSLEIPPFSSGWNAPIDAAALFLDGVAVNASTWRWTPYSVLRRTATADHADVTTEIRFVYESQVTTTLVRAGYPQGGRVPSGVLSLLVQLLSELFQSMTTTFARCH